MGVHMAANVRKEMKSSATLHIFDISQEACDRFVEKYKDLGRVELARSAKELAEQSATVISMVPMDQHAQAVYLDPSNGVIAAPPDPNRLVLECSTISVAMTRKIGRQIIDAGVAVYVDTPVSGGIWGAESGTLSFFCGHPPSAETDKIGERVREIVGFMGASDRTNFCGDLGSGLVTKIVNNYIGLTNIAVASQGLAFGLRHGVDARTLYNCIQGSTGDSWVLAQIPPVPGLKPNAPSSNGFKPGFAAKLCAKDISLAINAARQVGIDPSLGEIAVKMFQEAEADPRTTVRFYLFFCEHPSPKGSILIVIFPFRVWIVPRFGCTSITKSMNSPTNELTESNKARHESKNVGTIPIPIFSRFKSCSRRYL